METKTRIRKQALAARKITPESVRKQADLDIMKKVTGHPLFEEAKDIYCYASYQTEVDTYGIIEYALSREKRVAVPRVTGDGTMEFHYIQSVSDLSPGYQGIPEPVKRDPADTPEGLVIMPGVAFDAEGHRVGYGKGFYDRYLSAHPNYRRIAVAFESQMFDEIPADAHDLCPEYILTECAVYAVDTNIKISDKDETDEKIRKQQTEK
ncbi:5-formyltetrahydrofolate cyclo-ligase [Hespellia stercorisuis]|uniref:5-formyltetrahydrofolate cyclo-ligase n=1 Tax=Hespellia stercorisuis DSM 15480 TaxID=1121950 RepID=A0A1M6N4I1_9FIRM|nr:5-formyltetrahydrofolate cyclo-ligase [Hespellia stercorisuis]SHJ90649.1 5-formyltetrahydrofolate cyclo-ligase [Hespellia stercorisuis DSM 15480]